MVLFIIGIVLMVLGIISFVIPAARDNAFKWVQKTNFATNDEKLKPAFKELNDNYQKAISYQREKNGEILYGFAIFLIWLGAIFFAPGLCLLREYYVKQYCDGKIQWVESAYVNDNGEVRPNGHRELIRTKSISDRKTFYLQKDTTATP